MVAALAALLLSANLSAADTAAAGLSQVFIDACLDGQAKLGAGAQPVSFDALPQDLRKNLGTPTSSQVWRLGGSGNDYLYVLNYDAAGNASPRICGLASDAMDYRAATDAVEMRVTGAVQPRTMESVQWLNPKNGYDTLATTAGNFKVLQVNWLSDAQRALEMKQLEVVAP
jgi:hypothetical protein